MTAQRKGGRRGGSRDVEDHERRRRPCDGPSLDPPGAFAESGVSGSLGHAGPLAGRLDRPGRGVTRAHRPRPGVAGHGLEWFEIESGILDPYGSRLDRCATRGEREERVDAQKCRLWTGSRRLSTPGLPAGGAPCIRPHPTVNGAGPEENGTVQCSLRRPVRRRTRAARVLAARKPMLLLLFSELLLFRLAQRRLLSLLFHPPPRSRRSVCLSLPIPDPSLAPGSGKHDPNPGPSSHRAGPPAGRGVPAGPHTCAEWIRRGGTTASRSTFETRPRVVPCRAWPAQPATDRPIRSSVTSPFA